MFAVFNYRYVSWEPPKLSKGEAFAIGRRVAEGESAALKKEFRESIRKMGFVDPATEEAWKRRNVWLRYGPIALFVGLMVLFFVFYPEARRPVAGFAGFIVVAWLGSAWFAMWRHGKWLARCNAEYEEILASGYVMTDCPKCGASLRVPKGKGRTMVKCPCLHHFEFDTL